MHQLHIPQPGPQRPPGTIPIPVPEHLPPEIIEPPLPSVPSPIPIREPGDPPAPQLASDRP